MKDIFVHLRIAEFLEQEWELYSPVCRRRKEDFLHFHTPGEECNLRHEWMIQRHFLEFLTKLPDAGENVRESLRKIPDVSSMLEQENLAVFELFDLKKFLLHLRKIREIWSSSSLRPFVFKHAYQNLWQFLTFSQDEHSFAIVSGYSRALSSIRTKISSLRNARDRRIQAFYRQLERKFKLKKRIMSEEFTVDLESKLLPVLRKSPHFTLIEEKGGYCLFRIRFPSAVERLNQSINNLRRKEAAAELKVLDRLNACYRKVRSNLKKDYENLILWEKYFSLASMSQKLGLIEPELRKRGVSVKNGRYLPLAKDLALQNLNYTPLDFETSTSASIISGSNMGGKTQVLKAIGFLQGLFQLGFFLPAETFSSSLFFEIYFSAAERFPEKAGLSSFGSEISYISEALEKIDHRCLYLVDEFSRTTNIREGLALNYALLSHFSGSKSTLVLTTHFDILTGYLKVSQFQTGGLKGKKELPSLYKLHGPERAAYFHKLMDYHLHPKKGSAVPEEALTIAEILGLQPGIIADARKFLVKLRK
ncbi:MAG: hypothetical protein PHW04_01710 [Candidatus Wallbacteria bacterium]|nr:hypothetical protein [Candidatus Wallbacteria bacterium]